MLLQALWTWVDQQAPWPQPCQLEPFLALVMSHLGRVLVVLARLEVLQASQVRNGPW